MLARFVPVVRTVATVMAGAGRMNLRIYTLYSAIGGLLWVALVTIAGYYLGQIKLIADHVDLIVVGRGGDRGGVLRRAGDPALAAAAPGQGGRTRAAAATDDPAAADVQEA